MRYCKDCVHFRADETCHHPALMYQDAVRGPRGVDAHFERRHNSKCGINGHLYEPIPPDPGFWRALCAGILFPRDRA